VYTDDGWDAADVYLRTGAYPPTDVQFAFPLAEAGSYLDAIDRWLTTDQPLSQFLMFLESQTEGVRCSP
jgi:hypothetical protein